MGNLKTMDASVDQQFAVGAVTIAANRDAAIRAEVLRVGDAVRVLDKSGYGGGAKVHTGVIVGFEPFKEQPTIVIAYIDEEYTKAEMKMLYFNDKSEKFELLAAQPDTSVEIERSKVLDFFNREEQKKALEIQEIKAKRRYFNKYFGKIMLDEAAAK